MQYVNFLTKSVVFNSALKLMLNLSVAVLICSNSVNVAAMEFFSGHSSSEIIKSDNDKRHYRYQELSNNLRVLLISDPETEKSAASLDVEVGSSDDPKDREGLAHFLEHMLFLGTEKYPESGEYQTFISQNGGSHNAYTSAEHTNYFFDVNHSQLEPALDRFAQFFTAPLFTADYVERERNAVHSEYRAKLKDGYRRQRDVLKEIINQSHPSATFSVGSLETLANRDGALVRDDLLKFYQSYYSSDRMTLVVLGRESLDDLAKLVKDKFSDVALQQAKAHIRDQVLFEDGELPKKLAIQSLKDQRSLALMFPIPPGKELYRQKPLAYIGHVLGHEGKGSLLSLLKQQGWAESLGAGGSIDGLNEDWFSLSINLTPEGYEQQESVIAAVFAAIERLQTQGLNQWRFTELKKLADIQFKFSEKGSAINTVSYLSNQMQAYPIEDVIRAPFIFSEFDSELISQYLNHLTPDNFLWLISSKNESTNTTSELYQVPYAIQSLPDYANRSRSEVASVLNPKLLQQLKMPMANPFVPDDLQLLSGADLEKAIPNKIWNGESVDLWHKQDDQFEVPKASFYARIKSPAVGVSARSVALSNLYSALITDQLNEFSYPALLSGLYFSVGANSRGFDLSIQGYSEQQSRLLTEILSVMKSASFQQERFNSLKAELLRGWNNSKQLHPYRRVFQEIPAVLFSPYWNNLALVDAMSSVTFDEFNAFVATLWDGREIKILSYGNVASDKAIAMAKNVADGLAGDSSAGKQLPVQVVDLQAGSTPHHHMTLEHDDVVAAFYLQAQNTNLSARADMLLLKQMYKSSFFHELRTQQQLGYIVVLTGMDLKQVASSVFLVQSPSASLADVTAAISDYMASMVSHIDDFDSYKKAVIQQLLEPAKNTGEQAASYWGSLTSDDVEFDDLELMADYLEGLTQAQFTEKLHAILAVSSSNAAIGSLSMKGAWFTASKDPYQQNNTTLIKDVDAFKLNSKSVQFR
jgi:secreted Zn-dependent insulinase-like peptidase